MLVYYGLNQAGRAIAAAAANAPDRDHRPGLPADPWKLTGHGLKILGATNAMNGPDVASIPLTDAPGAFLRLAEILGCRSLIAKRPDKTPTQNVLQSRRTAFLTDRQVVSSGGDFASSIAASGHIAYAVDAGGEGSVQDVPPHRRRPGSLPDTRRSLGLANKKVALSSS